MFYIIVFFKLLKKGCSSLFSGHTALNWIVLGYSEIDLFAVGQCGGKVVRGGNCGFCWGRGFWGLSGVVPGTCPGCFP